MTFEEKREAIRKFCTEHSMCRIGGKRCPLSDMPENTCSSDDVVERNYNILVGAGDIVPPPANDPVNRPSHYTQGNIECIEAIEASMSVDEFRGFLKGQIIKYVWRYRHKGKPVEDLNKARWYADRLIELEARLNDQV